MQQLLLGMLEIDLGGAKLPGLVGLQVHLLRAADIPRVVERAGVAEVEAVPLAGERGNVWPGHNRKAVKAISAADMIRISPCRSQIQRKSASARMQRNAKTNANDLVR